MVTYSLKKISGEWKENKALLNNNNILNILYDWLVLVKNFEIILKNNNKGDSFKCRLKIKHKSVLTF